MRRVRGAWRAVGSRLTDGATLAGRGWCPPDGMGQFLRAAGCLGAGARALCGGSVVRLSGWCPCDVC